MPDPVLPGRTLSRVGGRTYDPVLPDRAHEDSDDAWGAEPGSTESREAWLQHERPPHHEG